MKDIDIDDIIDNEKWLDYKPKTELGKKFLDWSMSNLPRHMGPMDWNKPWAVAHTMMFERLMALLNPVEEKKKLTLFINSWNSRCGNCGKDCDLQEKTHETILGYNKEKSAKGCGVEWKYLSSDYSGMEKRLKEMRPDLIWIPNGIDLIWAPSPNKAPPKSPTEQVADKERKALQENTEAIKKLKEEYLKEEAPKGEADVNLGFQGLLMRNKAHQPPAPDKKEVIEQLADLEHQQWEKWSRTIIDKILNSSDPNNAVEVRDKLLAKHQSWLPMWVPYSELSEDIKEYDRKWARKVLEIIKPLLSKDQEADRRMSEAIGEEVLKLKEQEYDAINLPYDENTFEHGVNEGLSQGLNALERIKNKLSPQKGGKGGREE